MSLLTSSPAQNNSIISRIKLIALIYSHKTNVVIVTLLSFVMIYIAVIEAAFGVYHIWLPLVLTNFG